MRWILITVFLTAMPHLGMASDEPAPFAAFDKASEEILSDPHDLEIGPDGRLYVADKFGSRIAVLDADTLELIEFVAEGKLPGVHDVSFGPDGRSAVAVTGFGVVFVFEKLAGDDPRPVLALNAARTEGALYHPNGRVYAMAGGTGTLIAYEGDKVAAFAEGHIGAHDVALAPNGNIWVADNFNRRLVEYSPDLQRLTVIDHPKFGFAGPRYMDIDEFGRLIVADQDAHRILLIDPAGPEGGSLLGVLGTGVPGKGPNLFDDPEGVAVSGNRYYFSDSDNNRIVRYTVVTN